MSDAPAAVVKGDQVARIIDRAMVHAYEACRAGRTLPAHASSAFARQIAVLFSTPDGEDHNEAMRQSIARVIAPHKWELREIMHQKADAWVLKMTLPRDEDLKAHFRQVGDDAVADSLATADLVLGIVRAHVSGELIGEPCPFADCPPGLFRYAGMLCFKSEYSSHPGQQDAYCVDTGEYFWGGTRDVAARRALIVTPVDLAVSTRKHEA